MIFTTILAWLAAVIFGSCVGIAIAALCVYYFGQSLVGMLTYIGGLILLLAVAFIKEECGK